VHSSGCWFIREYSLTWATLVSATSRVNTRRRRGRGYGRAASPGWPCPGPC
jgi:hypothetical protein